MPPVAERATRRVAMRSDIGPRREQQDRAVAYSHSDGSWTIAVFDGLGGHARGADAAQAAAEAFPARIAGRAEMFAAMRAANTAVWGLIPDSRRRPRQTPWPDRSEPGTTAAAAAWTPEGGLQAAWMGDSVLFFVPVPAGAAGMHSTPQGSWDSPVVDNGLGFGPDPVDASIGTMPDIDLETLNGLVDGGGLVVIAATDGLFDPIRLDRHGRRGRFSDDPDDNSLCFAVPVEQRLDADSVADTLMAAARRRGLGDNAAVAVAVARDDAG